MDRHSANPQHSCSRPAATTHSLWLSSLGLSWTSPVCSMFCRSFSYSFHISHLFSYLSSPSPHLFQLNPSAISSSQQATGITSFSVTPLVFAGVSPQVCCPHRGILLHRLLLCQTQEIQPISAVDFVSPLQKLQWRTPRNSKVSMSEKTMSLSCYQAILPCTYATFSLLWTVGQRKTDHGMAE